MNLEFSRVQDTVNDKTVLITHTFVSGPGGGGIADTHLLLLAKTLNAETYAVERSEFYSFYLPGHLCCLNFSELFPTNSFTYR